MRWGALAGWAVVAACAVACTGRLETVDWEVFRLERGCRETGVVRSEALRLRHEWTCSGVERIWR